MSSKYCNLNIIFIYCNLFVFKILGLLPWKINLSLHTNLDRSFDNSARRLMNGSLWGLIYSVMLIVFNFLSGLYLFQGISTINRTSKMPVVIKAVRLGIPVLEIFSVTVMWILYILRRKTILCINEQLIEVGRLLNSSANYHWQVTPRLMLIFLINIGVSFILGITEFGFIDATFVTPWYVSTVASAWVLIQYALILEMIHHQLKMINKEILNLGNISDSIKIRNIFISKFPVESHLKCCIVNLKYAYVHLCEIFERLSNFYAIPVLSTIILFGSLTTFLLYYNFYKLYVIKSSYLKDDLTDNMWILIMGSATITLIIIVNDVKRQISIIPENIHWLLNLCSTSEDMENALAEFSYDLLSRKIEFTAYGIISLDGSLLISVLGSSITYLVILIQFQLN